jgi:hypothetical protein
VRSVYVDDETYELIAFAARAAGVNPGVIVARAVTTLWADVSVPAEEEPAAPTGPAVVPIFATYRGEHVTAVYDLATRRVTITSGPLARRVFRTPSAAATAVVAALNPGREMSRIGGTRFWRDASTGARLEQALPQSRRTPSGPDEAR